MDREQRRAFVLALLLGLLAARALRAFISSLWWQSLSAFRITESAWWFLLLLLPALLPRRLVWPAAAVAVAASALMPFAHLTEAYIPVTGLAAAASLAALLRLPLGGAFVGVALQAALLVAGASRDPTHGVVGSALLATAGAAVLVHARGAPTLSPEPPRVLDALPAALLLAAQLAFLANPFGLARWAGIPPWVAGLAGLGGLVLGATRLRGWGAPLLVAGALGALELTLLRSPLAPLSILVAQLALGNVAARLRPHPVVAAPLVAGLCFLAAYFERPYSTRDWALILPALVVATLAFGLTARRGPRLGRLEGAIPTAIVATLVLLSTLPTPAATADPDGDGALRVVTWNVRQGFGNRGALDLGLYERVLRSLDADVVILQESGPPAISSGGVDVPTALARALGMRATAGAAGISILSRLPIVESQPPGAIWSHEAGVAWEGATLWIHGAHLGRSTQERHAQAREILDAAEARPGPRIVAGDMNSCPAPTCFGGRPSDGTYDLFVSALEDAWVAAGNAPSDPAGNTHPAWAPGRRIDQVFVRELAVEEARVVRTPETVLGSDHLPVLIVARRP